MVLSALYRAWGSRGGGFPAYPLIDRFLRTCLCAGCSLSVETLICLNAVFSNYASALGAYFCYMSIAGPLLSPHDQMYAYMPVCCFLLWTQCALMCLGAAFD